MNKMISINDISISPRLPKSRGMRVKGVIKDFEYEKYLQNGYGDNIPKNEGIDIKKEILLRELYKLKNGIHFIIVNQQLWKKQM